MDQLNTFKQTAEEKKLDLLADLVIDHPDWFIDNN